MWKPTAMDMSVNAILYLSSEPIKTTGWGGTADKRPKTEFSTQ